MKITPAQQTRFLADPGKCRAFLFYGPDEGQTRLLSLQLIRKFLGANYDPMDMTEISPESLSEEPARLADELGSFSLLGGDRLVWIRQASNDLAPIIERAILSDPAPLWPLIVLAGDLRPTSKLRKLFEKEDSMAAIACYQDDARKVTQLLSESLRERGITCEQGVIQQLSATLGNDRAITLQEIGKIDLYLGEERRLSLELAAELCGDNRDHRLDALFDAVCGGRADELEATLDRCFLENLQPIGIYRMLNGHLQKLLSIQTMIEDGMVMKAAFTRHGVFFKQEAAITRQIQRWDRKGLQRAIAALLTAEEEAKAGIMPVELACKGLLHRLSRYGQTSRPRYAA
jgi:DNA polymerase-3 subunit delta